MKLLTTLFGKYGNRNAMTPNELLIPFEPQMEMKLKDRVGGKSTRTSSEFCWRLSNCLQIKIWTLISGQNWIWIKFFYILNSTPVFFCNIYTICAKFTQCLQKIWPFEFISVKGCTFEFSVLMNCFTDNSYDEVRCAKEIEAFHSCYHRYEKEKTKRSEISKREEVTPGAKNFNGRQLTNYLKKFPMQ